MIRNQDVKLPNNASQGLQPVMGCQSKMTKNPKFKDDSVAFMDNRFAKEYAENVPKCDDGIVWYIPHHEVYHPKKPNKIRVVFDCFAICMVISLNKLLLQAPDLATNEPGELLRFK